MAVDSSEMMAQLMAEQMGATQGGGGDLYPYIEQLIRQRSKKEISKRKREQVQMKRLSYEVNALSEWIHFFASLFGACPHCFGQAEECPFCHGEGEAGHLPPNEEALRMWLEPALNRLKLKLVIANEMAD